MSPSEKDECDDIFKDVEALPDLSAEEKFEIFKEFVRRSLNSPTDKELWDLYRDRFSDST